MWRFDIENTGRAIQKNIIPAIVLIATSSIAYPAPRIEASKEVPLTADQIASRLMQAEEQRRTNLKEYSATRRYVLENKRFNKSAEMIVKALYRKDEGKNFQVL